MARQKAFHPDQVIEKAMYLFWEQGYEATSIEDLVHCTSLGRGSLYDTFGDKHALYLAALDRYQQSGTIQLDALLQHTGPFLEILQNFFQARIDEAFCEGTPRGCFMVNASLEMAPHDSAVATRVQAALRETEEAFYHVLIKAQAAGEVSWTADAHQLARFLLTTFLGLRVLARAHPDRRILQESVSAALSVLR